MVNVFKVYINEDLPLSEASCTAPCCSAQQVPETLTHAFLDCPAVAGAVDWLRAVWSAIGGAAPPRDPQVLLSDDPRVWEPGGSEEKGKLWQRLRLTVLQAIWRVRCNRHVYARLPVPSSLATAIVLQAIEDIRADIYRDWTRATLGAPGIIASSGLPSSWFRGRDPSMQLDDFKKMWACQEVLCKVLAPPQGSTTPQLVVHISSTWNVVPLPAGVQLGGVSPSQEEPASPMEA